MSTSQQVYGTNVYPGWVWILPNMVFDQPSTMSATREGEELLFSIREYFTQPEANIGMFQNREIKPFSNGTHSMAVFDSDIADIIGFAGMLDSGGLTNGERDFTIDSPTVYYAMPVSLYTQFIAVSPLYNSPVIELPLDAVMVIE